MSTKIIPTKFQLKVMEKLKAGRSVLLVAPTGLGKTYAVSGDIEAKFQKIVYAVPLRALGSGIREELSRFSRNGKKIEPVVHHGTVQESTLFSEEVVITTYDQVVCGVPGLPLSLPLKAGHAVAGAILMSRLILDEVHLAWSISEQALSILLAIIDFRKRFNLPTVLLTATLPNDVATLLASPNYLDMELIIIGEKDLADDKGLMLREENRSVDISFLEMKSKRGTAEANSVLIQKLRETKGKRIYFANTVKRLQGIYDDLISSGVDSSQIIMLHNQMPSSMRTQAEELVHSRFGKNSVADDNWILLTNQVAEAGLDISAPLVISDPAPVDTLLQRAGRCARWFRNNKTFGEFYVIKVPNNQLKDWSVPYREQYVDITLKTLPQGEKLTWQVERKWINEAWGLSKEEYDVRKRSEQREEQIKDIFTNAAFALNLFDRAAQEHTPGKVANAFREVLSIEVAVEDFSQGRNLEELLEQDERPETSPLSLGKAYQLLYKSKGTAKVIRYNDGLFQVQQASYLQLGDVLILPSDIAYIHNVKGLCLAEDGEPITKRPDIDLSSKWYLKARGAGKADWFCEEGRIQLLSEHAKRVISGTYERFTIDGQYRKTLIGIMSALEPNKDPVKLANLIAQIACLSAAFHDLGKADKEWQRIIRENDPDCPPTGLIGRTGKKGKRIKVPHSPPGYNAILKACELLVGSVEQAKPLFQALALASVRHHSSLLNPSLIEHKFSPHEDTLSFIEEIMQFIGVPNTLQPSIKEILDEAKKKPRRDMVPLMLPANDLFPVYALVGRAIMMADREDASGGSQLEVWK